MKKTSANKTYKIKEIASEYHFDYHKAKPNRFAGRMESEPLVIVLEPDIAKVFSSSEQVNKVLRALISAIPKEKIIEK